MGYLRHKAILVHGGYDDVVAVREDFVAIMLANYPELCPVGNTLVSNVVHSAVNSYGSFMIAPDGSKEGWGTSTEGDRAFTQIKSLLDGEIAQRDDPGGWDLHHRWVDYVEIEIGGDDGCTGILASNLRTR